MSSPVPEKNRWKVGCLNKTIAREMEAAIKTRLLLGHEKTEQAKPILFKEWATAYLNLESIKTLRSYQDRLEIMERQLIPFFGGKVLTEIRPHDVEAFRAQRKKKDGPKPSIQTVNNDHIVLKHCLNLAIRRGLLQTNQRSSIKWRGMEQTLRGRKGTSQACPTTRLSAGPEIWGDCRSDLGPG